MTIATDIETKLKNNQHIVYITDADDLLAAWRYKRQSSSKRSKNLSMVPTKWRYSAPPNDKSPLMPCHVSYRRKLGHTFSKVEPAFEYTTRSCHHTHNASQNISVPDLEALETVDFSRRNVAPFVSPILDAQTLALVCKDLGITGQAIPKVIKGRQYIAFSGYPGLRTRFPGTIYSAKNKKIIQMAIGSLGVKNMVKNGGILTICITVPLTILECFLRDQVTMSSLIGNIASDLIKIGIGVIIAALFGLMAGAFTTVASFPIIVVIGLSVGNTLVLNNIDDRYRLTEKLIAAIEEYGDQISKSAKNTIDGIQRSSYHGISGFLSSQGLKIPNY